MENFQKVRPLSVKVKDLSITIRNARSLKETLKNKSATSFKVLDNVSFNVVPGQIVAIMGSSGSGKTTLLHCLAGRSRNATCTGSILFDNLDPKQFYSNGSCGYIQQNDYLMPYLTVRQTLRYTAELRLSPSMSIDDKYAAVESVILELGLKGCADTIIGDDLKKGISGGEKRRVSVACQLLINPSILFMDEPTTGLDSFTSISLIQTLQNLAARGRTIFITIHQPRSDIFKLFNSIFLLSKGRFIYAGAAGETVLSYFNSLGLVCPDDENPADFLIDTISIDANCIEDEEQSKARINMLAKLWKTEEEKNNIQYQYRSLNSDLTENSIANHLKSKSYLQEGAGIINQTIILSRRIWMNNKRDNMAIWGGLFEVIFLGLVYGTTFYQLKDNLSDVLTRRSSLFTVGSSQCYLILIFTTYIKASEIKVFERERSDNMYGVIPYLLSRFFSMLPLDIVFSLIYSLITYFMIGFRQDDLALHFTRYALANLLGHLVVVQMAQTAVAVFRKFPTASLAISITFTFFVFSAGYFVQLESIPIYLRWITKVSFLTYQFRLLATNEFSNMKYACKDIGIACPGNSMLQGLGIKPMDYLEPILGLTINFIVFFILNGILLKLVQDESGKQVKPIVPNCAKDKKVHFLKQNDPEKQKFAGIKRIDIQLINLHLELDSISPFPNPFAPKHTKKVLLENVSTSFKSNSLSVIMGGSGTGKSTLLSVLCGRNLFCSWPSKFHQRGSLMFNGQPLENADQITSICSFVRQSDSHLIPSLTCRETLMYAARLRLPHNMSHSEKSDRVDWVLTSLGIKHCANTVVGNEHMKGLSGGEKRRLSIGIQMLNNPSVFVFDEPTSGLDATSALQIMNVLRNLANNGHTIICSIHQPRSSIFKMFDDILLLSRGGRVVYSGAVKSIIPYLELQQMHMEKFTNPADFILDISSVDFRNEQAELASMKQLDQLTSFWEKHQLKNRTKEINFETRNDTLEEFHRELLPFRVVFPILVQRSFLVIGRQPMVVISRVMQIISLAFIEAIFLLKQGYSQTSVQNRLGAIQQILSVIFVGLLNCVASFPSEKQTFLHDHADRIYSVEPFFMAYNIVTFPFELVGALVCTIMAMYIIGLNTTVVTFISFMVSVFCFSNLGESIAIMFCTFSDNVGLSVSLTNSVLGVFLVMSGLLSSNMPVFLDRINRLTPIPYFTRLMTINEFHSDMEFTCTPVEKLMKQCIYHNGTEVLRLLSPNPNLFTFDPSQFHYYLVCGIVTTISYRILAYILFKIRAC
ncbi:P-loop containing nucleoside triphosphate hydrolase protein [Globomyces pollinis-pini]|nr:P-loop containing nucleoside triphosphate hydrolase protein [Globomyces pollinis-pini]